MNTSQSGTQAYLSAECIEKVKTYDFRRRSASKERKDRMRIVFKAKNKTSMTNTATTTMTDFPPFLLELSQGTHLDLVVREYPAAQVWHSLEVFWKPKSVAHVLFLFPGQAKG